MDSIGKRFVPGWNGIRISYLVASITHPEASLLLRWRKSLYARVRSHDVLGVQPSSLKQLQGCSLGNCRVAL